MEMNGSQEAKGLWSPSNICKKTRPFSVKPIIDARILQGDIEMDVSSISLNICRIGFQSFTFGFLQ